MLHCGRRWGKTTWGANEGLQISLSNPPSNAGLVVAPSYGSSSLGKCWNTFLEYLPRSLIREIHRTPGSQYLKLIGDRMIHFRSAENPEACRGEGYSWAWLDEPAGMSSEIWEYAVLPALADKHGKAWFTGTPKGRNWYYLLCMKGYDPQNTDWKSFCYPSVNNTIEKGGVIHKEDLDAIARNMSERAQRQELGGEFLSDAGAMFRNVKSHISGFLEPPNPEKRYSVGVDLGKHEDYSVIVFLDGNGHVCHFDRRNRIDWPFQRQWISDIVQQYNKGSHGCRLLVDSTGLGDPFLDEFKRLGLSVEGYKFTAPSKHDLIENLAIQLENNKITYPDIPDLLSELDLFGYTTTQAGNVQYTAPEGFHDDCVIALALAVWQMSKGGGPPDAWRLG